MLDQPLDVGGLEARDLMEVVNAETVQRTFEDRVDALQPLKVVPRSVWLNHDPCRRTGLAAGLELQFGFAQSCLQPLEVVEHALVNTVKNLELGAKAFASSLRVTEGSLRVVALGDREPQLTSQVFGRLPRCGLGVELEQRNLCFRVVNTNLRVGPPDDAGGGDT